MIKEYVEAIIEYDLEIIEKYLHESCSLKLIRHGLNLNKEEIIELLQYLFEDTENNIIISKIIDFDKFSFVHSQLTFKEHGQVTNRLEECILFEWAEDKIINIESYAELVVKSEITQEWLKSLDMYSDISNLIECS